MDIPSQLNTITKQQVSYWLQVECYSIKYGHIYCAMMQLLNKKYNKVRIRI